MGGRKAQLQSSDVRALLAMEMLSVLTVVIATGTYTSGKAVQN